VNGQWSTLVLFLGAFAWLQLLAVFFNLVPVPSLDGFGIIEPYLDSKSRETFSQPQVRRGLFFVWFFLIWQVDAIELGFFKMAVLTMSKLGFGRTEIYFCWTAFNAAVFGTPM
jgi:Zn-dependent protease